MDADFCLDLLAVVVIVMLDWRAGDGFCAIYFSGFGALAAIAWTIEEPARSWRGWLAVALLLGYGGWRRKRH